MKVVYQLGLAGLVETVRGRNGGLRLAKEPKDINIGAVIRSTENDFFVAECFDRANDTCAITPECVLKHSLHDAMEAFLAVLDKQTLQDLLPPAKGSARPIKIQRGAAA